MIKEILKLLNKKYISYFTPVQAPAPAVETTRLRYSTDDYVGSDFSERMEQMWEHHFKKTLNAFRVVRPDVATDNQINIKSTYQGNYGVNESQLLWFGSQSFIGYQVAAIISQHWLVSKACLMPAEDATRNGYKVTVNDGTKVSPEVLDEIRKADTHYRINENLVELVHLGRIFGIRVAKFMVDSNDPDYYYKPFNPDGIEPNSYKGISQIDPYWISPQLDNDAAGNITSIHFNEPTWWNINGQLVHRTHLIIFKTEEVPDILKPLYIYGGIPVPQKIAERVYAAERTANEAPMLALTKRTSVLKTDNAKALGQQDSFDRKILRWVNNWTNYGIKTIGLDEEVSQLDTSLADFDNVIMTQFQLVAAAANVPAVKLLGTSPKGFNTTGEYEEASYHEYLKSLQKHKCSPLLERHHLLLIRSEIAPKFNISPFSTTVEWNPLDEATAQEKSELNKSKAETDNLLIQAGAIDGTDVRERIINDPESGYSGLSNVAPEPEDEDDNQVLSNTSDI